MNTKVKNYINQDKFTKNDFPDELCYQDFSQQDESFFNYDEQQELFEYFLNKREERILFSFRLWIGYTLAKIPSFSLIQELIKDTLSNKIETLCRQEQLTIEECFDFLDYVNALSQVMRADKILEYFDYGLSQFKEIIIQNNNNKEFDNYIQEILYTLAYILKNANIIVNDEIIIKLTNLKDIINEENYSNLQSMYISLILDPSEKNVCITPIYKDMILFILQLKSPNIFNPKFYLGIINKIENLELLKEFLIDFFPKKQNFYDYHDQFDITFLIIDRLKQLNISIEDILYKDLNQDQPEELLKYIGYTYKDSINEPLEVNISSNKININYLKQPLKDYIIQLSSNPNFEFNWDNTIHWCTYIFKDLINTPELYNKCSDSAKKLYHSLAKVGDTLWNILPLEVQNKISEKNETEKQVQKKKKKISELRENKKVACINDFFDKDTNFIEDEIEQIKKYFGKSLITYEDIDSYKRYLHFIIPDLKINEFLNKDIVTLNTFLIDHFYHMYYFLRPRNADTSTINIINIFEKVLHNWEQYWGLYLYNYLINIEKYNFEFTPEQTEKLRAYFTKLQTDNSVPVYVYWYLEKLFHISIPLTEDIIILLLKTNYLNLKDDYPVSIIIYDTLKYDYRNICLCIDDSLAFEQKDFSNFISHHRIDKKEVLNKLLETVQIENSCFYDHNAYFHLLSIINIYELLDDEEKSDYTQRIKNLCKDHIDSTIQNAERKSHTSNLVLFMIEQFELTLDILTLIDSADKIHEMHLAYVTKIQKKYFRDATWNTYKDILYSIRKDIELNHKTVIPYNYSNIEEPSMLNKNDQNKLSELQNKFSELQQSNFTVDSQKCTDLTTSLNEASKIFSKYNQNNKFYEKKYNFMYLLAFLDIEHNINIWEIFCEKALNENNYFIQDVSIEILSYMIQHHRINQIDNFVDLIVRDYDQLQDPKKYPKGEIYSPTFEFIIILQKCIQNIITTDFEYDPTIYPKLLEINKLDRTQKDGLNNRSTGLKFVKITKSECKTCYLLNDTGYDTIDELVKNYLSQKLLTSDYSVSQIRSSDYLIEDMKNKIWTMSHPYCFEDPVENLYPIDKRLYISCWSFTKDRNNSYAWWKLYGKNKRSFRSVIPITSLIKSAVSILDKCPNSTLYVGSVKYDLLAGPIYHHTNPENFFKKKEDFSFEKEFRVMIDLHEYDIEQVEFEEKEFINIRCSFTIDKYDVYKDIDLTDSVDNPKFNPYIKDILEQDKKAILTVIEQKKNELIDSNE